MKSKIRKAIEYWQNIKIFNISPDSIHQVYEIASTDEPAIINFTEGTFIFNKTIFLGSKKYICGLGIDKTQLILEKNSNCHLFSNLKDKKVSELFFSDFVVEGNIWDQKKPTDFTGLVFSNAFYLKNCVTVIFENIATNNIRQTGLHFSSCSDILIEKFNAKNLGWSGISTSGTDNIRAINFNIINSGLDVIHSGIHLDGGIGAYLSGTVDQCVGNGIMIDSAFAAMRNVFIKANVSNSKRGVSLSGAVKNALEDVYITGKYFKNREVGVMVSNSDHVFINECLILENIQYGILLQGRQGGRYTTVVNCDLSKNGTDIAEHHASCDNYFLVDGYTAKAKIPPNSQIKNVSVQKKEDVTVEEISYKGVCHLCGYEGIFLKKHQFMREGFRCPDCSSSIRHRAQAAAIINCFPNFNVHSISQLIDKILPLNLNIYEPGIVGPLQKYFSHLSYYKRSYFWLDIPTGELKNGIQCQNLEKLTFKNDLFDLLITSDIFEHIRHPWVAFKEVFRVLKHGGYHIFTIPVQLPLNKKTVYRVNTDGEEDVFLLEPRYHIAGDGDKSLVYTEFGEDIIQELKYIGFEVEVLQFDPSIKEIAPLITFKTRKPLNA